MQRTQPGTPIMRAAQGLAIHGDNLPADHFTDRLVPGAKTELEGARLDQRKDLPEGVMGGGPLQGWLEQLQELPQPLALGALESGPAMVAHLLRCLSKNAESCIQK
jgi:hypothetical protein